MQHNMEKLDGNKVKFSFEIPANEFDEAVKKAYLKSRGKISIPGFRRGKAPLARIEAMYGKGVFYEDAFDLVFPDTYEAAVEESGIKPVSQPSIDIEQMESGKDLKFSCEVYNYPEITLGQYKDLSLTRYVHQVTDDEIDAQIEKVRDEQARIITLEDGVIEPHDKLNLDYAGTVDGVAFDGGTAEGHILEIGSGQFIPGFEDQLIGMDLGTEQDVTVTFPEKYHSEELAGKEAIFHVKLNSVERKELPEIDDDFVADISEFDTLDEYRANLFDEANKAAETNADNAVRQDMLDQIIENSTFDIPQPMIERQLDSIMQRLDNNMRQSGYSLDMFLQMIGNKKEDYRKQYQGQAKHDIASDLVLDELVKIEKCTVSDEDIEKEISLAFENSDEKIAEFKSKMTPDQKENIEYGIQRKNIIDSLFETAKVETIEGDRPSPEEIASTDEKTVETIEEDKTEEKE